MQIQFEMEGGFAAFPGLNQPVMIDTATLPPEEGAALEKLVKGTCFFDRPERGSIAPPGAADYRHYTITVHDGGQTHTVRLDEPIDDAALQTLVGQLQAAARRVARGGNGQS